MEKFTCANCEKEFPESERSHISWPVLLGAALLAFCIWPSFLFCRDCVGNVYLVCFFSWMLVLIIVPIVLIRAFAAT